MTYSNTTSKAKPRKHAELIKAWADGAEIQTKLDNGEWFDVCPQWNQHHEYRIKPEPEVKKFYVHNPVIMPDNTLLFGVTWQDNANMEEHLEFVFVDGKLSEVNMKPPTDEDGDSL